MASCPAIDPLRSNTSDKPIRREQMGAGGNGAGGGGDGGAGGNGDGGGGGGGGGRGTPLSVPHTTKPADVTEPSVCHVITEPADIATLLGPIVPLYRVPLSVK